MFNFIKNLFRDDAIIPPKIIDYSDEEGKSLVDQYLKEPVSQSGLIIKEPTPTDFIYSMAGVSPQPIDWLKYLPSPENQSVKFYFDTMSCTTFSALNVFEMLLKPMTLPPEHLMFLTNNGYFKDGELNFSDKFTAIMSGTTPNGNDFQSVANSIRHDGLIPETMLPFGDELKWQDWHSQQQITKAMIRMGQEFVRYFDIVYEFVMFSQNGSVSEDYKTIVRSALATSPLQAAMPFPGSHAIAMVKMDQDNYSYFDTYSPFLKQNYIQNNLHYAMKLTIIPRKQVITTPLIRTMKRGMRGTDVRQMQVRLNQVLTAPKVIEDGDFGPGTEKAVQVFQRSVKLTPDGIMGNMTYNALVPKDQKVNIARIKRISLEDKQCLGEVEAYNKNGRSFFCKSLELPWLNNQSFISCIPPGTYVMKWIYWEKMKKWVYEITNVPNRYGIYNHPGNYYKDYEGCVGFGRDFADMNNDGYRDITDTVNTIADFAKFFNHEDVTLVISQ